MFGDTSGSAPSRAVNAATASVKRFRIKRPRTYAPVTQRAGKTILSLPMEIQEEILSHLIWYDHFSASMVCPEWATLLQQPRFRQKRYCIETWSEQECEEDFDTIPQDMGFRRYHPDETLPKNLEIGPGGLGMHGLLGTGTMVLSVRETGETRVYLAIRHSREAWKGKDRGDYVGPLMKPYEEMFPFDVGVRRCRWKKDKHKAEISFHEITGSPLLATDPQFYFGTDTHEKVPEHIQARIKKDCTAKYWANDSDTWKELRDREDDISVRILDKDVLTDGTYSRVRRRCDFEYLEETTVPGVLPISAAPVTTGTTIQRLLGYIKEALVDEQDLDNDGPLECWATFQEFWPQRRGEAGPEDIDFHPRRKIFLSLCNLSRWSLDPKKDDLECTCDGDGEDCECQWFDDLSFLKHSLRYKTDTFDYDTSDDDDCDDEEEEDYNDAMDIID
ncbi:hypothetical protein TWF730_003172 [Orbilia blumenaviensis]|uniref:F-box domain-containing protein n=1 Tax=Orbilia blumenaviensis TaxID=1796055 RepID=A0AAV9U529_9PEZI